MEGVFDKLQQEVETTVRAELETFYRMSGNHITSLFKAINYFLYACRGVRTNDDV